MPNKPVTRQHLIAENEDLRTRLAQAEETLREMRSGDVDALFVPGAGGAQLFTLRDVDLSFRLLVEEMSEGALTMTAEGVIVYANRRFADFLKTPLERVIGSMLSTWMTPDSQPILQSLLEKGAGEERSRELVLAANDGTGVSVQLSVSNLPIDGSPDAHCLVAIDLTGHKRIEAIAASERVARELLVAANQSRDELLRVLEEKTRAEAALRNSEAEFRLLAEAMPQIVWITQADGWHIYFNQQWMDYTGLTLEESLGHGWNKSFHPDDQQRAWDAWQRATETIGTYSIESRLRRVDGVYRWWLVRGVPLKNAAGEIVKWFGTCTDIHDMKMAELEIARYVEQLQIALKSTVEVVTKLSEMRDPYTAGHERRVAEIAVVIGAELGFDARRQEGLRVAGHLHDVGKISIPSEILSKPGKLGPVEFLLIQGHARAGYDVLKDVEFPWPVAQVTLQHHERMDGSGYPQGLKGKEILIEARIMTVADVVEAISSHRPYRPGLGIEAALAEIERGRGSAYDTEVADACLRVFRQNGYQLPE
jgi:PAS domain S-box-containing protein